MINHDIRSFVRRQGRLTRSQLEAIDHYGNTFLLPVDEPVPTDCYQSGPLVLEIGFGNGASLVEMAHQQPTCHFIGVEVHTPGVGHCLRLAHQAGLENLRIYQADAMQVMAECIPSGCLSRVNLFFPDPWPKKRHHKRRIVRPAFVSHLRRVLAPGAIVHFATDWQPYAEWTLSVFAQTSDFTVMPYDINQWPRSSTKFEARGRQLGHQVSDLVFEYQPPSVFQ